MAEVLQKLLGIKFNNIDTTQKHALGAEVDCDDGTRRKYVRAGAATITQWMALRVDVAEGAYDYDPTTAAGQAVAGVAPLTLIGDNNFFWAVVRGKTTCVVAAAITAGLYLVPTATLGSLDDTAAAAADAEGLAAGVGVLAVVDDVPSAGFATVVLT